MAQPNNLLPCWIDRQSAFTQFVRHSRLPPSLLVNCHCYDGFFDVLRNPVFQDRPASRYPLQCLFTASIVQVLELVEAVAIVAMILQAFETLPTCLASSRAPTFILITFCACVICIHPVCAAKQRLDKIRYHNVRSNGSFYKIDANCCSSHRKNSSAPRQSTPQSANMSRICKQTLSRPAGIRFEACGASSASTLARNASRYCAE